MKAMILCAGLGTRLRPLTNCIPKPLVPAPDEPLVFHSLRRLARAGATLCVVNLHHLPRAVKTAIGDDFEGMRIVYSHEPEILGHAGGLRKAAHIFEGEPFLVMNGDIYADVDCGAVMRFHKENNAAVTVTAKTDLPESDLNLLGFDSENTLRTIRGKPGWSGPALSHGINAGVFVYDPSFLDHNVPPGRFSGFAEVLQPLLEQGDARIRVFPYTGYWTDIGDAEKYLCFLREVLDGKVPGIPGGHMISGDAGIAGAADIIAPCHIAAGCVVEDGARIGPYAVLGRGCAVGRGSHVAHCLVAPGVHVPGGAMVKHSVFCSL
jgi:NDP-sugar pyrophosphorylase family protein